jgi:tetratricopeptide (TPR) repeat protein
MAGRGTDELRYTAFLSYSHKDAKAAARLHRRLESFRMPRRLVGKAGSRGPLPERLWPIFRDRDELPAATDLSKTVRQALARSGALIILCSPHAAQSLWVAEEIRTFREMHPERPILPAIVEGEPADSFPDALRALGKAGKWHEPLATDLRRNADGERLGLLKLVAGITGVGLDDLVQRDASRRIRRVTAVTVGAVVMMLITTALALLALDARSDAERQRAEAERQRAAAEGQIEFMLTELRSRLRGVGRIEIMQTVNSQALRYYGGQRELGRLPADSLLRRSRILQAIGEDDVQLGRFDAALSAFSEARRTTAEQLARNPANRAAMLEHARNEYRIGRIHEARQAWPLAGAHYRRASSIADRLIAASPGNADYMMIAGSTRTDLGNYELKGRGDAVAAQRHYESAAAWFGRAAGARPRDMDAKRAYANAFANLADTYYAREQWRRSADARLRQYRLVEEVQRAEPANMENLYRLALAGRGVGASLAKVGDPKGTRSYLTEAYAQSRRLTRHDPRNAEWLLLEAMLGCELLFREGTPLPRATRDELVGEVASAGAALDRQDDPRRSMIANCRKAIGTGAP